MNDTIALWGAPNLPGLIFRRLRKNIDLPALVAVHAAREAHDQMDLRAPNQRTPTVEELETLFIDNSAFNAETQLLIAEVSGQVVGYAWIRTWASAENIWILEHSELLRPEWRGKGIGKALMRWAEDVLGYAAQQRPSGVNAHYQTSVTDTEREAIARLEAAGYQVNNASAIMRLDSLDDLPSIVLPEGLQFYTDQQHETLDAHLLLAMIFDDDDLSASLNVRSFLTLAARTELDPTLWRILIDEAGTIVGVVLCDLYDDVGVITELGVKPAWRGRGAGRALLVAGLHALRDRGATQAMLYTNADDSNIALKLYESVGFRTMQYIREYAKPVE